MAGEVHGRRVTRRAVLRALGGSALAASAVAVAACQAPAKQTAVALTRSDDDLIRDRAIAASRRLEAGIRAALAAHPDLASRLDPVLAYHERHVTVVAAGYRQPPSPSPSLRASTPTTGSSTTGTPTPPPTSVGVPPPSATALTTGTPVPPTAAAALTAVAAAERATSDGRSHDVLAASGDLARLLASIAACETVAARTLGG